jgi:hypothetical protein
VPIEFTYARTPGYFRWDLAPAARRAAGRRLAGALGLALLGFAVIRFGDDVDGVTAVWVGAVFAVAVGFVLSRARRRYVAMMAVPPFWCAARHYVIDDEAIRARTELSAVTYHWPLVRQVWIVPEAYVLHVEHFGIFDVPRAPLTEQQDAELRTLLTARGLLTGTAAVRSPTVAAPHTDPDGPATV